MFEIVNVKSKAIHVTVRRGIQGCEMSRIQHPLDSQLTDGDEFVSLMYWLRFMPKEKYFLYRFLLETESTPRP
jgi:hypothetical protein